MLEIEILPSNQPAALDPRGAAFAYGFGLFETIQFAGKRLAFWDAHWQRLDASAQTLGLNFEYHASEVLAAIKELLRLEAIETTMVKLSLVGAGASTKLYIYLRPIATTPESVRLKLNTECPIYASSLLSGHKTHNYMENMLLLERAKAEGFYDCLRVDDGGYLAETTIGNLFFVTNGKLCTPSLKHGILPGVIRGELLQLTEVEEGSYTPEDLQSAEAIFMTNSGCGILPIAGITGAGVDFRVESSVHHMLTELIKRLTTAGEMKSQVLDC
ncbi:MAG: aminotransferase class IV [Opitutaceae bacterium]